MADDELEEINGNLIDEKEADYDTTDFNKRASAHHKLLLSVQRPLSEIPGLNRFPRYALSRVSRLTLILPESTRSLQATERCWIKYLKQSRHIVVRYTHLNHGV